MNVVKSDMKRAVFTWEFALATAGAFIAVLIGCFDNLSPLFKGEGIRYGFHAQVLLSALSSDIMLLVVPIPCTIPYTASFVDDCKSGYIRPYLLRSGRRQYIKGKVFATGFSGGMTLFCGIMTAYIFLALLFTPLESVPQSDIPQQSLFLVLLTKAFLFFLSGMLWSLAGLVMSALSMSKYMAYASPFVIYYLMVILSTRYFQNVYCINRHHY